MTPNRNHVSKPRRTLMQRIWGALPFCFLVVLIIVIVMFFGRIQSEQERLKTEKNAQLRDESQLVNVVTLDLVPRPIKDRINLPGTVVPWIKLDILAEVRGKVLKKLVRKGSTVKKGALIARIDPVDYENAFKSIKASYGAAKSELSRLEGLYKEQLATKSQLDNARAQVESMKASLNSSALNVERCNIKAPISGIVNDILLEEGQYLNVTQKVAQILQIDRVKVKVGIPETDVDSVRSLTEFKVEVAAINRKVVRGKKLFLSKTADPMARVYNLEIVINNSNGEILPDMFARVEILKKQVPRGLAVPLYAVISRNNNHSVYVVEGQTVRKRRVELGMQEGSMIEIVSGLSIGDNVIVVGQRSVSEGQTVNVIRKVTDSEGLAS